MAPCIYYSEYLHLAICWKALLFTLQDSSLSSAQNGDSLPTQGLSTLCLTFYGGYPRSWMSDLSMTFDTVPCKCSPTTAPIIIRYCAPVVRGSVLPHATVPILPVSLTLAQNWSVLLKLVPGRLFPLCSQSIWTLFPHTASSSLIDHWPAIPEEEETHSNRIVSLFIFSI